MSNKQPLKTVYLVRHGQSVHNVAPVFQSTEAELSEVGVSQADTIAARAENLKFDALIASPYKRALQTAEAIAEKTSKSLEVSELFVERMKPNSVDGKSWNDPIAASIYAAWEKSLYDAGPRVQDGETYSDIVNRADRALAYLEERPEDSILVVTHGNFLRTIVARILVGDKLTGDIMKNIQMFASMENTGITVLHFSQADEAQPQWRLWTYNDHAHFAE